MEPTPLIPHAQAAILLALSKGSNHGYAIRRMVSEMSANSLNMSPGTLYGALQALMARGLIEEIPFADNRRREYRLTRRGWDAHTYMATFWRQMAAAADVTGSSDSAH